MNRQVIPSMLLSVLIVCVFAIVLFERDPEAAGGQPGRAGAVAKSVAAPPSPSTDPSRADVLRPEGPPRQVETSKQSTSAPAPLPVPADPAPKSASQEATVANPAATTITPTADAHSPMSTSAPIGPHSAFTVVQKGETLKDVAVRVYGSSDRLAPLWRANRDLLPKSDSPLSAGAVLRTPEE